jgi:Cu2+-containing amine oxidase
MAFHPLRDLTANEIKRAASLIKQLHRNQELVFKAITLDEPNKNLVLRYFKAQENGTALPKVPRIVFAAYYFKGTVRQCLTDPRAGCLPLLIHRVTGSFHNNLCQPL